MTDYLGELVRTHTCGALRESDVGHDAVLLGWVDRVRDLGSLIFIDVRDRFGTTQVVVREDEALRPVAKRLRPEFVVAVMGPVELRSADTVNSKLDTGTVEIAARKILVLNESDSPPFQITEDVNTLEKYQKRVFLFIKRLLLTILEEIKFFNGNISSFDASLILQYIVDLENFNEQQEFC